MKYKEVAQGRIVLRLDPGDDIHESIEKVFADQDWKSGFIWGLGSVENPVLAHYKISDKQYSEVPMHGTYEIASLNGTAAQLNENLTIHLHVVVTDEEMKAFGGHLVAGKCSATAEIILTYSKPTLHKKMSEQSGLNVWDF